MSGARTALTRQDALAAAIAAGAGIIACFLVALALTAGAGNCSAWYAIPGLCTSLKLGFSAAAVVGVLPLLVVVTWGRMLPALLGLYVVLVPIDDALLISGGLSVTKIVGILVAIAAAVEMLRRRTRITMPYAVLGWLALVAFMVLSLVWSINPEESVTNVVTIASAFMLLVILVLTPMTALELRMLVVATIISGAVIGIVALILSRQDVSELAGQVGRLYLTFGSSTLDPNRFGASLLLPTAMTVGGLFKTRSWWIRIALIAILGLTFTAIYLSASRGTLVALAAMAIVAIMYSRRRLLLSFLLAISGALVFLIPSELSRRLSEGTGATGTGRTDIWGVGLAAIPQHWVLGSGQGTFVTAYDRAFFLAYEPQFLQWHRDPHNLIISTAVELGVLGLFLMVFALVLQYRILRLIAADDPFAWLRPVLQAAFIGLVVAAMFVDVMATKFAWLLFTEMLLFAGFAGRLASGALPSAGEDSS